MGNLWFSSHQRVAFPYFVSPFDRAAEPDFYVSAKPKASIPT
jgi:hypothetical protein